MDIIRSLVQSLIVIVILAVFLEMLLPAGGVNKYVKMVVGLLIIVAVVQAVGNLLHFDFTGELQPYVQKKEDFSFSTILENGERINAEQQVTAIEQYRQGLENQIKALARVNREVSVIDVKVEVQTQKNEIEYGQLQEIVLFVSGSAGTEPTEPQNDQVDVEVEPVTVRVERLKEDKQAGDEVPGPPREEVSGLINTIADFYNISPEQVRVVFAPGT